MQFSFASNNYNSYTHNVEAIIEALQANGYQTRMEREGGSNKRHQLLGVGLLVIDSAEQYVIPCYTDTVFEMNPIVLREGKLLVTMQSVGKADSVGYQWFESTVCEGNGRLTLFMTTQDRIDQLVPTARPMPEPVAEALPKDKAAANTPNEASAPVTTTPTAESTGAAAA